MDLEKGEIVLVDLGDVSQIKGHEQALTRPCLVWKNINNLKLAIVMPITSKKTHHYSVVSLKKGDGGLEMDSYVLCFQIRTISHERITKTIDEIDHFSKCCFI